MFDGRNVDLATPLPSQPEVEPNDDASHAQVLASEARIGGAVAVSGAAKPDQDWFAIVTPPAADLGAPTGDGGSAPPHVAFLTLSAGSDALLLELVDARGKVLLARTARGGQRAHLTHLALSAVAPTLVRVRALGKTSSTSLAYTLEYQQRIAEPNEELEPNDDVARAFPFPLSGAVSGRLDGADDKDLFVLPVLHDGSTYRVELVAMADLAPEIRIRSGTAVLSSSRTGRGGELRMRNVTANAAEPLLVALRAIDGMSELDYQLRVTSEPPVDAPVEIEPNDDRAHANPVIGGTTRSGFLWPGDADWFCSTQPIGARIDAMPEIDWRLESFTVDGKALQKVDTGRRGAPEVLSPTADTHCIKLTARARETAFDAPYQISFVPAD